MSNPTCFISYSWDSTEHKAWVRIFAERLQQNSVFTYIDQWDISLGSDVTKYMEQVIRKSDFVLLICTPNFANKANTGKGGVGYEKSIVTGEIFCNASPETKFIPVLREGSHISSLPSYLKSRNFIDFTNNEEFESKLIELLRHIYKKPKYSRPKLGKIPFYDNISKENRTQTEAPPVSLPGA